MVGLIVHEWAEISGGAEKVVDELLRAFPGSALQVLWNDAPERFVGARETWLARTPLRRHKALALPLLPATWRGVSVGVVPDWILASSHLFAHHVRPRNVPRETPKYSYVHTPARYIWEPEVDDRARGPMVRVAGRAFRGLDRRRAQESVAMAANSRFTRDRVQRAWGRDASVIYPPVEVHRIMEGGDWSLHLSEGEYEQLEGLPSEFVLGASRFVPYKRLDWVIDAGSAVGTPVVLAGSGPEQRRLEYRAASAKVPVLFVVNPSDAMLYTLYQRSIAFIFPAIEDFGIMPVEAVAAGGKVIVWNVGGAAETVEELMGGVVLESKSCEGWRRAVDALSRIDTEAARKRVTRFDSKRFRNEVSEFVGVDCRNEDV